MRVYKKIFCRMYQKIFHLAIPFLPYREPEILNSCADLGHILKKNTCHKVMIVTDQGIVEHRLLEPVVEELKISGIPYVVYDKTQANPSVKNVEEAVGLYHQNHCDALIAIGGGSSMDCAKAVGARIAYPQKTLHQMKGLLRVLRKLPLLIAIPTTAGTGSETTLAAVITDTERQDKYALMSFTLIPRYAILDPTLTYSLPQHFTATTGMDALTHAVEAYIGRSTTKETRKLAMEAIQLIFENIETAYQDPYNDEARKHMLHASYKAGIAFSKSYVGYIHAIAHSLGGQYGTAHGLANAVIMPYVLEKYGNSIHDKLYELAQATQIGEESDSKEIAAGKFIEAIKKLNHRMNISDKIKGIQREDIKGMAIHAAKEANPLYPVPKLMDAEELEELYIEIADWSEEDAGK